MVVTASIAVSLNATRKFSSSLYREYTRIGVDSLDLEVIQGQMLNEAKKYTYETDDSEILIEIQHYGGRNQPHRLYYTTTLSRCSLRVMGHLTKMVGLFCKKPSP